MIEDSFLFRAHTQEDIAFLDNSWGASYYPGIKSYKFMSPHQFHAFHRPIRHKILSNPQTKITVCCPKEDQWHILGYIISDQVENEGLQVPIIHYLYVKDAFREPGLDLAQALIKPYMSSKAVIYTHLTHRGGEIMGKHQIEYKHFNFIPHLI